MSWHKWCSNLCSVITALATTECPYKHLLKIIKTASACWMWEAATIKLWWVECSSNNSSHTSLISTMTISQLSFRLRSDSLSARTPPLWHMLEMNNSLKVITSSILLSQCHLPLHRARNSSGGPGYWSVLLSSLLLVLLQLLYTWRRMVRNQTSAKRALTLS